MGSHCPLFPGQKVSVHPLSIRLILLLPLDRISELCDLSMLLTLSGLCSPSIKNRNRDFPGGPEVKNLPTNAGAMGSIPVKIPQAQSN